MFEKYEYENIKANRLLVYEIWSLKIKKVEIITNSTSLIKRNMQLLKQSGL
jgi:hypothetical protein